MLLNFHSVLDLLNLRWDLFFSNYIPLNHLGPSNFEVMREYLMTWQVLSKYFRSTGIYSHLFR